jgi:hypothetical protein
MDMNEDHDDVGLPCQAKLAFDTLRQANAAANVAEYQHGAKVKAYQCQYCGLWHLSSA